MDNITIEQMRHFLVNFASIITAGGVICIFALKVGKKILSEYLKPFSIKIDELEKARIEQHKETKEELNKVKEELKKNSLNTLKNTICNENIPLSERVEAGEEYIEKGGNGAVKVRFRQLEEKYNKELEEGCNTNGKKKKS